MKSLNRLRIGMVFCVAMLCLVLPVLSFAHSGGRDAYGGHYNKSITDGKPYECHSCGEGLDGMRFTDRDAMLAAKGSTAPDPTPSALDERLAKIDAAILELQTRGIPVGVALWQDIDALRTQVNQRMDSAVEAAKQQAYDYTIGTVGNLSTSIDTKIAGIVAELPTEADVDAALAQQTRIEDLLKAIQGMNLQGNLIANYNFANGADGFVPIQATLTAADNILTVKPDQGVLFYGVNTLKWTSESTRYRIFVNVRAGGRLCVIVRESGPDHQQDTCVETSPTAWSNIQVIYNGHAGEQIDAYITAAPGSVAEFQVGKFYLVKD